MSNDPSLLVVKKTPGREGDQQPSVRYDEWYLLAQNRVRVSVTRGRAGEGAGEGGCAQFPSRTQQGRGEQQLTWWS
jgi:hypothetical protein